MVFALSLILLYAASCLYHGIPPRHYKAKKVLRVIDHCSIFILIAGTSTPFVLCVLGKADPWVGWFYNLLIWTIAAAGIALLFIDLNRFKKVSILLYLVMGFSVTLKGELLKAGIGDAVVGAYKAVEDTVVGGYKKVEDAFVDAFLEKTDDHSAEEQGPGQSK